MFGTQVEPDSSTDVGFDLHYKVDCFLEREDSKKIGYSLEFVHCMEGWYGKVNFPLLDVDSTKVDSFLVFDYSMGIVLVLEKHSKVDFPPVRVGSHRIGYFQDTNQSCLGYD